MITVWYISWSILVVLFNFIFNFILILDDICYNTILPNNKKLSDFLHRIRTNLLSNYNATKIKVYKINVERAKKYPLLTEIIFISDININELDFTVSGFKKIYKDYIFINKRGISLNRLNKNNNNFLNFIILSRIIFVNFFFSLRYYGLINRKLAYSSYIIFCYLFLYINKKLIKSHFINFNYVYDILFLFSKKSIKMKSKPILFKRFKLKKMKKLYFKKKYFTKSFIKLKRFFLIIEKKITYLNKKYLCKFSPSDISKYLNLRNSKNINILYLRKNKIFNKGRYSRNRQYYRTGVYWSIYINIIAVIALYFWFYRFTMNFGYLWWILYIFIISFFFSKFIKFKLYNPFNLINSIYSDFMWFFYSVRSIYIYLKNVIFYFLKKLKLLL